METDRQHGCRASLLTTIGQRQDSVKITPGLARALVTSHIPFASPCPFCYTLNFITVRGQAERALLTLTEARAPSHTRQSDPEPGVRVHCILNHAM